MRKKQNYLKRYSPTILSILGGIGVIGTAVLAAKATPKAMRLLEEAKKEKEELTTAEKVVAVAPAYVQTVTVGFGTICCILGANILNKRNQAALISSYALIERSYREYKAKNIELFGEEAHNEIVESIEVEHAKDVYIDSRGAFSYSTLDLDTDTGEEKILFYDAFSKRYFEKKFSDVLQAEYHLNKEFISEGGYISVSSFYDFLGLENRPEYNELLWILTDYMCWIDFNHRKVTLDDGLECVIIEFPFDPMLEKVYEEEGYL